MSYHKHEYNGFSQNRNIVRICIQSEVRTVYIDTVTITDCFFLLQS